MEATKHNHFGIKKYRIILAEKNLIPGIWNRIVSFNSEKGDKSIQVRLTPLQYVHPFD